MYICICVYMYIHTYVYMHAYVNDLYVTKEYVNMKPY